MFIKFNANPKGKKTGDCVTRAISKAAGIDYHEVLRLQYETAVKTCYGIVSPEVEARVIESLGFTPCKVVVPKGGTRPTIATLAEQYPSKRIIAQVANHLTCAVNGDYYDTWDCGYKKVYKYYIK